MPFNTVVELPRLQLELHSEPRAGDGPAEGESNIEFQRKMDDYADDMAKRLQIEAGFHAGITPPQIEAAIDHWIETKDIRKADRTPADKETDFAAGIIRWHFATNFQQITVVLMP